jgi:hypothetical protein
MKKLTLIVLLFTSTLSFSQIATDGYKYNHNNNFSSAKEWNKERSLFLAKSYLFKNVLGTTDKALKFNIIPVEAAKSGELTTLFYKCEELNKSGMILSFWGNYWNESGVVFKGYAFKNLEKAKTISFLNKIESVIDENLEYLREDYDNNNISFDFDDIQVLIWVNVGYKIRVFWNGFDSTLDWRAFEKIKKDFEKKF